MSAVIMPKSTAVWLIENTGLTFEQIASFCGLHPLEVKAMADGDSAACVIGQNPITNGQLAQDELERCSLDPSLRLSPSAIYLRERVSKGPRYTPISKRHSKPGAIAWLLKTYPQLSDRQICKLIGTTKPTVNAIRSKSHRNSANLQPSSPVQLGLCNQQQLDQVLVQVGGTEPTA